MAREKIAAVIAEYNPFHNGHAWQLHEIRRRSGADRIVVLMSGDFVQRGGPAITDKYTRTRMALLGGANLVLELPLAAAAGSAGEFAAGAAAILDGLGVVDELWFGSELGEIRPLEMIAEILAEEPECFRTTLRAALMEGKAYPAAQERAAAAALEADPRRKEEFLGAVIPDEETDTGRPEPASCRRGKFREKICIHKAGGIAGVSGEKTLSELVHMVLSAPNNQLGISYISALRKRGSRIQLRTLKREGADYHSTDPGMKFSSAEGIRSALYGNDAHQIRPYLQTMPDFTRELLGLSGLLQDAYPDRKKRIKEPEAPLCVRSDDFSEILFAKLLREDHPERYAGVSESLANRIRRMRYRYRSFSSFAELLKTRDVTRTRADRALLHILLDVTKEDVRMLERPQAVRVLGMRDAEPVFHAIREKRAKGKSGFGRRCPELTASASRMPEEQYRKDRDASDLYEWVRSRKTGGEMVPEYSRMPVKL